MLAGVITSLSLSLPLSPSPSEELCSVRVWVCVCVCVPVWCVRWADAWIAWTPIGAEVIALDKWPLVKHADILQAPCVFKTKRSIRPTALGSVADLQLTPSPYSVTVCRQPLPPDKATKLGSSFWYHLAKPAVASPPAYQCACNSQMFYINTHLNHHSVMPSRTSLTLLISFLSNQQPPCKRSQSKLITLWIYIRLAFWVDFVWSCVNISLYTTVKKNNYLSS